MKFLKIRTVVAIVLLLMVLCTTDSVVAQGVSKIFSEIREINDSGITYTQKIVAVGDSATISFSQSSSTTQYVFYYTDVNLPNNVNVAELPQQYEVKDMVILEDRIYFCGQTANANGFIARAKINDLFFSSSFDVDIINNAKSIDKIEVYLRPRDNAVQIVTIGTDANKAQPFFLHSDEAIGWHYDFYYPNNSSETFDDLELNEEYVLSIGTYFDGAQTAIIVRRYEKNNIPNFIQRTYPLLPASYYSPLNKFHAKTIQSGYLAIVGTVIYNDPQLPTTTRAIMLVSDVNNSSMPLLQQQYLEGSQSFDIMIRDLSYHDADGTMLIVSSFPAYPNPNNTYDAVLTWDVSQSTLPTSVMKYYTAVGPVVNPLILLNGVVEYKPYLFAAIGVDNTSDNVNVWYANRQIFSNTYHCSKPLPETLYPMSMGNMEYEPLEQTPDADINWSADSANNYVLPAPIVCSSNNQNQ
jgi:hypothetical protein